MYQETTLKPAIYNMPTNAQKAGIRAVRRIARKIGLCVVGIRYFYGVQLYTKNTRRQINILNAGLPAIMKKCKTAFCAAGYLCNISAITVEIRPEN